MLTIILGASFKGTKAQFAKVLLFSSVVDGVIACGCGLFIDLTR